MFRLLENVFICSVCWKLNLYVPFVRKCIYVFRLLETEFICSVC